MLLVSYEDEQKNMRNEMQQRQPVIDEQTMSLLALAGVCEGGPVD